MLNTINVLSLWSHQTLIWALSGITVLESIRLLIMMIWSNLVENWTLEETGPLQNLLGTLPKWWGPNTSSWGLSPRGFWVLEKETATDGSTVIRCVSGTRATVLVGNHFPRYKSMKWKAHRQKKLSLSPLFLGSPQPCGLSHSFDERCFFSAHVNLSLRLIQSTVAEQVCGGH